MQMAGINLDNVVNCRIGSLEKVLSNVFCIVQVNCRIGSLENLLAVCVIGHCVNCRIGSLEM